MPSRKWYLSDSAPMPLRCPICNEYLASTTVNGAPDGAVPPVALRYLCTYHPCGHTEDVT